MATEGQQIPIGDGSLQVGDRVVYPNQGICRITGVSVKEIAGGRHEMVTLAREEDGATVMVPKSKVMGVGLRKVASVEDIDKVFDYFAEPGDGPQLDWKVRHRENADRMHGGGLFGTVEVLKSLHSLSKVRPLPQKERELYDSARHLMVGEIAAALNLPLATAEDHLDYVLWPPQGMTRKGKKLEPATIGMALKPRPAAGDDDLGFDDDEEDKEKEKDGGEEAKGGKEGDAESDEETDAGGEEAAAKKPAAKAGKPAPKAAKSAAPAEPHAVASPSPLGEAERLAKAVASKLKDAATHAAQQILHAAAKAVKPSEAPAAKKAEPAHAAPAAKKAEPAHAAPAAKKAEPARAAHGKPVAEPKKAAPAKPAPKAAPAAKPAAAKAKAKAEPAKKAAPKAAAKAAPKKPAAKKAAPKAAPKKGKK